MGAGLAPQGARGLSLWRASATLWAPGCGRAQGGGDSASHGHQPPGRRPAAPGDRPALLRTRPKALDTLCPRDGEFCVLLPLL